MERTGADVARVRVGPRVVEVRRVGERLYESGDGRGRGRPSAERVDGLELTPVVGRQPARGRRRRSRTTCRGSARCSRRIRASRTARTSRSRASTAPGEVTARVWERGVGETTASGSSAVAVAAATHGEGDVVVHFPGGDLRVRLEGGRATLTGPAEPRLA